MEGVLGQQGDLVFYFELEGQEGGPGGTDAAGRWCKRSWSSTPLQEVHFLEDNDVCLFVILPEGWKHPQIS